MIQIVSDPKPDQRNATDFGNPTILNPLIPLISGDTSLKPLRRTKRSKLPWWCL